ncbi:MAG: hypothetical protein KY469_10735 [Actinobacteria bacterium]|nr:hypothetical protein [Actinomycetota bacterium]
MAATTAGAALTEAHRVGQVRLAALTVVQVGRVWPALDPADLTRTWPALEQAITALVTRGRPRSAQLTLEYLRAFLQAEAGRTLTRPEPIIGLDRDRLVTSLRVTGPVTIKQATAAGAPLARTSRTALAQVAAAASRHVLDAGRATALATALNEGFNRWTRVSDGSPCAFCAMLVSRGPVYLTRDTAEFQAHDRCGCTVEVVVAGDGWTPQARRFHDIWNDATRGERDQLTAFRRVWEGRTDGPRRPRPSASRARGFVPAR